MTFETLKFNIENHNKIEFPLILKYCDIKFLCKQYIEKIREEFKYNVTYIDSIDELPDINNSLYEDLNSELYIYDTDTLDCDIKPDMNNLIVICKDIKINLSVDYIDVTKILPWHVEDYVKFRLPGLDAMQIKWLCDICKYDVYRLDNECKKIEIFPEKLQKDFFEFLNISDAYCDLNSLTIFNFTNAVMKKDLTTIKSVIENLKYIDIEGSGLITIFYNQFKKLISIQMNPKATPESLGMSQKQFNAIKYGCGKFTDSQLIKIFNFITGLDMRLKNGEFQFSNDSRINNAKFVDYITSSLIYLGNIV